MNNDLEPHLFFLVFLHELAHLEVWLNFGRTVRPHGEEWKKAYSNLVSPFIHLSLLPEELIREMASYFQSPKATLHGNSSILKILHTLDGKGEMLTLEEISENASFFLPDGREMVKLNKLRSRYKCFNPGNKRYYLIPAHIQIFREKGMK
jgi:hypothetical protein